MSVQRTHSDSSAHRRLLAEAINRQQLVVKNVTLTLSSATTTVTDERMGEGKTVLAIPTNTAAAGDVPALTTKSNGSFIWTHSNNATTRTFDYVIVG